MRATSFLLLLLIATCSSHGALVGWWRLDEFSGNIFDETGLNPEAVPAVDLPTYGEPGVPNGIYGGGSIMVTNAQGTSIAFGPHAVDEYFVAGSDNNNAVMNIDMTGQLTVMGWIRPSTPDPSQTASFTYRMINTGTASGTDRGWGLGVRFTLTNGVFNPFARFTAYGIVDKDIAIPNFVYDEWMHIAATYDNGSTSLYVNGNFLGIHADLRTFGNDNSNNRLIFGGRMGGTNAEQTYGSLDGIRVYDTVLNAEAIRAAARESVSVIPEPAAALLTMFGLPFLVNRRRRQSDAACRQTE